jgi:hypothetical protein
MPTSIKLRRKGDSPFKGQCDELGLKELLNLTSRDSMADRGHGAKIGKI